MFALLLDKLEEQRRAYQGRVFDVLGEAFEGQPLRDLLVRGDPVRRPAGGPRHAWTRSSTPASARASTS